MERNEIRDTYYAKFRLLMNMLMVVLVAFAIKATTAYAGTTHHYSLKAYNCNKLKSNKCVDDNDQNISEANLQELTEGSYIAAGKVIRLDVWYSPGPTPDTLMQIAFSYDPLKVTPVHNASNKILIPKNQITESNGGAYPDDPDDEGTTLWTIQGNDDTANQKLRFIVKDPNLAQPITHAGRLLSVYVTVNEGLSFDTPIAFAYDQAYTMVHTHETASFSDISLKAFVERDGDTSLSAINVTSGGVTYPTKETVSGNTTTYHVYVPNGVSSVNVEGIATKTTTTVSGGGSATLAVSTNKTVTLRATAEDESYKDYNVIIYRLDNNANLSGLVLSGINYGTFSAGTTTYSVTVPYTTSSTNVSASTASTKASVSGTGNKTLTAGTNNAIEVVVTPENCGSAYSSVPGNTCTTKKYTVNVTRTAAATNNNLSSLLVNGVEVPNFSPDTLEYTLSDVTNNVTSVEVTYVKENEFATVTGDGTRTLSVGNNQLNVVVKSQSGVNKTYKINIKRLSNDSTLKSLTITSNPAGTQSPATFNAATLEYTYTVGPDVTEVSINGVKNHTGASVSGNGTYNPNTTSLVNIEVKAEDNTKTTYKVNLVRTKSTNADLSALSVTGYTLNETFNKDTLNYTLTVPSNVTSVTVNATKADSRADMTGDGNLTLTIGSNNVATIHVVAEDETTYKDYKVTVTRQNNDADLSGLVLSGINYGTFNANTLSYAVTVPYTTTQTNVSATTHDTKAQIASGTGNKTLAVGANTIEVLVKAEDRNVTKKYTVVVTRTAAATNNNLSSLTVDGTEVPNFSPDTLVYNLDNVANNKSQIVIGYVKENEFAQVSGDGTKTLVVGDNSFDVTVTSQSGVSKTYTINVRRLSNDSTLKALTITSDPAGTQSPATFNAATLEYTYTVGPDVTEVSINGVKNHTNASVSGNGTYNPNTTSLVNIEVKAEDNTKTTYKVNLVRNKSTNADLSALSVDGYTLDQTFGANTLNYTLTVPSNIESVNVSATKADSRATMTGDGNLSLTIGSNNVATIHVVAEDGTTYKDYKVTVTRQNNDATLSALSLTNVDFGTFVPGTTDYTATVPYTTSNTTVSATANDSKAEVTYTANQTLGVGENTIEILVKAEDRNVTNTYTVVVTRTAASTNANLASLKVDNVSVPNFDKNTLEYTLNPVANNKTKVNVTATAEEDNAQIIGDGEHDLIVGENTIEVTVKSQSNDELTYKIHIKRLSNDSTLKELNITSNDGSLDPTFSSDVTAYTYTVGPDVTEVVINGVKNHDGATVDGNNTYNPQETTSVTLKVTAEDESYTEYVITLNRTQSSVATLSALSIEDYPFNEDFSPDTTTYTVTIPENVDTITINATPSDGRADVDGDGEKTVNPGENTFVVTVEAEDGTPKEYTIVVTRPLSSDNTLSDLKVDGETIDGFLPEITEYDLGTVPNDVESINIGASTHDPEAGLEGTGDIPLAPGVNTIPITVTAPNGEPQTYTITVNRALSDNNYLSALSIDGIAFNETFKKEDLGYTADIPSTVTTLHINATPEVTTSSVTGAGDVTITEEETQITITCTSQSGVDRYYTITVHKVIEDEFITSIEYGHTINDTYILTGNLNATVTNMKDELDNDNSKLEVWNADETEQIADDDYIATGYIVKLMINGVEKDRKIIVIKGDTTGDGKITLVDAVAIAYHVVKLKNVDFEANLLTGAKLEAAYVTDDDKLTLVDAVAVAYHVVKAKNPEREDMALIPYKTIYTR